MNSACWLLMQLPAQYTVAGAGSAPFWIRGSHQRMPGEGEGSPCDDHENRWQTEMPVDDGSIRPHYA